MSEIKTPETNSTSQNEKPSENFDPDKRVDSKTGDTKENHNTELDNNKEFDPDKRVDNMSESGDVNPYNNIPKEGPRGSWEGEPGDSKYVPDEENNGGPPSGKDAKDALEAKGKDGIEYTNGEPDFSEVAEDTVEIDDMSEDRYGPDGNFAQADQALADKWNAENHGGRNDWTARDIKDYRQSNRLTWHERQDCQTMDLVDRDIHQYFTHIGGVAFCKARNNSEVKFDE